MASPDTSHASASEANYPAGSLLARRGLSKLKLMLSVGLQVMAACIVIGLIASLPKAVGNITHEISEARK